MPDLLSWSTLLDTIVKIFTIFWYNVVFPHKEVWSAIVLIFVLALFIKNRRMFSR